jgi:quercetin dioxygenase-like cupin family protein
MSPSPVGGVGRDDLGRLIVTSADQIEQMPWEDLRGLDGVSHKVLWRSGDVVLGLIRVAPGHEKPEHVHHGAHHHILITQGSCAMVGETVGTGSYVYIPPDVPHAVTEVGPDGVTFFYTYRPVEMPPTLTDQEHGHPV